MSTGAPAGGVTLQVNVAPTDLPHASLTLAQQLTQWGGQVDDVIFVLDLHKSAGPRGADFDERVDGMRALMAEMTRAGLGARSVIVDYSPEALVQVADRFFDGVVPPLKDCAGAPFFAYFYGLAMAQTRYVLHLDCDVLFGGGSQTWIGEACELLRARTDVLFVSPLAGPPTDDGRIPSRARRAQRRTQEFGSQPILESSTPRAYRLRHVSSRVFLADLRRLREAGPFEVLDAPPWTHGSDLATTPFLPVETVLSSTMKSGGWLRVDLLGEGPGMWFLHPGQRGPAFAANLPNLIDAVQRDEVPSEQRGDYELLDAWLDSVGPERIERASTPLSFGQRLRRVARAVGLGVVRNAIWRVRWHWSRSGAVRGLRRKIGHGEHG